MIREKTIMGGLPHTCMTISSSSTNTQTITSTCRDTSLTTSRSAASQLAERDRAAMTPLRKSSSRIFKVRCFRSMM